jgi:hypothetical protein
MMDKFTKVGNGTHGGSPLEHFNGLVEFPERCAMSATVLAVVSLPKAIVICLLPTLNNRMEHENCSTGHKKEKISSMHDSRLNNRRDWSMLILD